MKNEFKVEIPRFEIPEELQVPTEERYEEVRIKEVVRRNKKKSFTLDEQVDMFFSFDIKGLGLVRFSLYLTLYVVLIIAAFCFFIYPWY